MRRNTRPKAYSYIRFSTPEQELGDSLRRQTDAAAKYAARHGLDLDDQLTFRDLGVSAYTGANEETGRLGEFLAAVEHGDIAEGSFLLVESLDRLSRQKPRKAVKVLERICEAGITVVTLDDGRTYTEETLDEDPWALMVALMVASRAHEESAKKGKRVAAAWANKRTAAKNGHQPLTAICPGWLRLSLDRTHYEVIPQRADIVRLIFSLTLDGVGQHSVAQKLNIDGVPVFGRGKMWQRSYISKMLADPAVIGNFTPHRTERVNGKKVRVPTETIEGYFPSVIEREVFERVASMVTGRPKSTRSTVANILAGLARCPLCTSSMTRINKGAGSKGGKPFLVCSRAKVGAGCEYKQVQLEDVEYAILNQVDEFLAQLPSPNQRLHGRWEELVTHQAVVSEEIDKVVAAIAQAGHSKALLERLSLLESERDKLERELEETEAMITESLTNRVQHTVKDLREMSKAGADVSKINATMRQLFTKVVVDFGAGDLFLYWRHAGEEALRLTYAMPSS